MYRGFVKTLMHGKAPLSRGLHKTPVQRGLCEPHYRVVHAPIRKVSLLSFQTDTDFLVKHLCVMNVKFGHMTKPTQSLKRPRLTT